MDSKIWWKSKTVWFNVVTLVLQIVNLLMTSPLFSNRLEVMAILTSIQTVGNIVLRFISTQPITLV